MVDASLAERPIRFRGGGFVVEPRRWAPPLFFALLIAAWQIACDLGWIPALFLPSPLAVLRALQLLIETGELWQHLGQSLTRLGLGWTLGSLAGILAGLAMGIFSNARAVGLAGVSAFFPIPKIALLPLFILWLGIGEASKVTTIALGVFFPMTIATFGAIDAVPRNLIRMGQSFDLPWVAILWKIVLPGALPGILSGVRITISIALILLVAAEMIGAQYGIGAFILLAGNLMQTDQLIAGVALLSALGLTFSTLLTLVERSLLKWR